ncbi:trypsin-like serine protease [Facilibium subflavum]|uniref:trypsin-like serine protease n=1 Tax=Facilibium subflavum TaxID=2219058 RepID=UPI000E6490FB|nr:trypsin-like serine protease [Facilibium subflavum]
MSYYQRTVLLILMSLFILGCGRQHGSDPQATMTLCMNGTCSETQEFILGSSVSQSYDIQSSNGLNIGSNPDIQCPNINNAYFTVPPSIQNGKVILTTANDGNLDYPYSVTCSVSADNSASTSLSLTLIHPSNAGVYISLNNAQGAACSGILLGDKLVLTAAHCFDDGATPDKVYLSNGNSSILTALPIAISSYQTYPDYPNVAAYKDIAYLILNRKVDLSNFNLCIPNTLQGVTAGLNVTYYGYATQLFQSQNTTIVDPTNMPITQQNYDDYVRIINAPFPRAGDSGGPLVERGSPNKLIGLVQEISAQYVNAGQAASFTMLSNFKLWLEQNSGQSISACS